MYKLFSKLFLAAAFGLGCVAAANADHDQLPIEACADSLRCQADDLQDAFRDQFRKSDVYGQLIRTAGKIERNARIIRNQSDARNGICRVTDEINETSTLICELQALVEDARFRAASGWDAPLCGCTLHVDAKIATIQQTLILIRAEATAMTVGPVVIQPYNQPFVAPQPNFAPTPTQYYQPRHESIQPTPAPSYYPSSRIDGRNSTFAGNGSIGRTQRGIELNPNGFVFHVGGASIHVNR